MPSTRYRQMQSQVRQIGTALLPGRKGKDLIDLTPRLSMRALSYRILCHAEIESYLEDRVIEIALTADKSWKERGHICNSILCLLAFSEANLDKLPQTLKPPPNRKQADWENLIRPHKRLSGSVTKFINKIRNSNNGIKEQNIIEMILPIGFDPDLIDELLLADLNDFGTKRGSAAHTSVLGHVTVGINPNDERKQVERIISGLASIDGELNKLLKTAT